MFSCTHTDTNTKARTGTLRTQHGSITTPFYMPVATKGALKYAHFQDIEGYDCIITNALLHALRPGLDIIRKAGGLHGFMGYKKSITTDSGGFQLLSDSFLIKTTIDGAYFKNPFTGERVMITPEKLAHIQESLGSDIAMVLDDVLHPDASKDETFASMRKTHEWARRCKAAHTSTSQLLFGIVQGGLFPDLREHSAKYISALGFDGCALGGLAIGEPLESMFEIIKSTIRFLPEDTPRYLMGVGSPVDMVKAIGEGIDMFDSTFPTRNARHGTLFTSEGSLRISNERYKKDFSPIEEGCDCPVCTHHSRAYLHHLIVHNEPTGRYLATVHNLAFMQGLIEDCQAAIAEGCFKTFADRFTSRFGG